MAIVMTVDKNDFFRQFEAYNRVDQFSYEGLEVLFDYLEQLSDETGEPIELDVVSLCCEYNESSIAELIKDYSIDVSEAEDDEDEIKEIVEEYLQDNTSVCGEVDGGFVYAVF